jgi:hypothetical protein
MWMRRRTTWHYSTNLRKIKGFERFARVSALSCCHDAVTERDREGQRVTESDRERQRVTERDRERQRVTESDREGQRVTQRDRE